MKRALISGVTGQDGSYLAELLLSKGYEVHGIIRRSSSFNTGRISHIFQDLHEKDPRFFLHYGDLSDSSRLEKLVEVVEPDEVYNLGAQSHVRVSFDEPVYTADIGALGTLRFLEAIRNVGAVQTVRFYQASSSEIFGKFRRTRKRKRRRSIRAAPMPAPRCSRSIRWRIIARHTACMRRTEFCSTTKVRVAARPS